MPKPQPGWRLNGKPGGTNPSDNSGFVIVHLYDPAGAVCQAPVAAELNHRYPGTRLIWVADLDSAELFMDHASVNEVVVYPGRYWRKKGLIAWLRGMLYAAGRLRNLKPLKGIILRGGMEARLLLSLAGVKTLRTEPWKWGLSGRTPKDAPRSLDEYGFRPSPSGSFAAQRLLSLAGLGESRPIALAPFGSRTKNEWPMGRYARLAGLIARRGVDPVIILGGETDRIAANALAEAAGEGVISLAGKGGLLVTRELLRHCRGVVGGANVETLMAAAIGVPAVVLASAADVQGRPASLIYAAADAPGRRISRLSVGSVLRLALSAIGDRPVSHKGGHARKHFHPNAKAHRRGDN